jgi:predicted ferric reductase
VNQVTNQAYTSDLEPGKKRAVTLGSKKRFKREREKDILEAIWVFSVVAVICFFLLEGGLPRVITTQALLDATNRLSALIATNLLLVQVILISRAPWLEKVYGLDKTTRAHKRLGKPILYLLLLHFVSSIVAYSVRNELNFFEELGSMLGEFLSVVAALISLLAFVLIVISSLVAVRKRASYEVWYLIHLVSYVAIVLAIPHQLDLGSEIVGHPIGQMYWLSLYFFAAYNLIYFRVLAPILRSMRRNLQVSRVVPEKNNTTSVYVSGKKIEQFNAKAGQFFMLRVMTPSQWWRPHPFSVSAKPTKDYIRFTIGNRGDDTAKLQELKPGTRVMLEGPFGVFTEVVRTQPKVLLMAAGIGVAPIRALVASMAAKPGDVNVLYRVKDVNDAALLDELREICKTRGFTLTLSDGPSATEREHLSREELEKREIDAILSIAPDVAHNDVFICGPIAWSRSVEKTLRKLNVPKYAIHSEEFAW